VKAKNKFVLPERLSVALYEAVEVQCNSDDKPTWYFEGEEFVQENERSVYDSWLYIDRVLKSYIGTYTCVGTAPSGATFEEDFVLSLKGESVEFFY